MNISFSTLVTGNSGPQAPADPGDAAQHVDAFLLLMGTVPDAAAPHIPETPLEPEAALGSTTVSEDDLAAEPETLVDPALPLLALTLFPQMVGAFEAGPIKPNLAQLPSPDLSGDREVLHTADTETAEPSVLVPLAVAPVTTPQIAAPVPGPQAIAPDPNVRTAPPANPDAQTLSVGAPQTKKADSTPLPPLGLAKEIPTAPAEARSAPAFAQQRSAEIAKADTRQPSFAPLAEETTRPTVAGPTVLVQRTETKAEPVLSKTLAPMADTAGLDLEIAKALQDVMPKILPSQASTSALPVAAQAIPAVVLVNPRIPVQDTPAAVDVPSTDKALNMVPSVTKAVEGHTPVAPMTNGKGDISPLPPMEAAASLMVEPLGQSVLPAQETGSLAQQPISANHIESAEIDLATQTLAVKLADLATVISRAAASDASQSTTLQLDPIELGTVAFNMDTGPSGLIVTITAERPETLELLRRHADQFIGDLRQSGFLGASLQFGQSGAGHSPQQDQPAHRYQQGAGEPQHAGTATLETATQIRRQINGQALDLRL